MTREEITELVEKHSDELYAWTFRQVRDRATAEDLVQECFISAYTHHMDFQGRSSSRTWLFSILKNKVFDHFRSVAAEKLESLKSDSFAEWFDDEGNWRPERRPFDWGDDIHLLDQAEFRSVLNRCMDQLPPAMSACLRLKYLDEKNTEEVCQSLKLSPSNLWQIIHRAKLQMRSCIERNWFGTKS